MTPTTLTAAARAALAPPPSPHIFGDHQTVPPESISALRLAYQTIIQQLRTPATAAQGLLDWAETLVTASMIAETIDRGVPELQPHIDDMHRLAVELEHTGQVLIDAAQYLRLIDAADVIDSLMRLAPHDVVLACAYRSEAMRREKP